MDEANIRFGSFLVFVLIFLFIEYMSAGPLSKRWRMIITNFSLVILSSALLRVVAVISALAVAYWCEQNNWGLFNWLALPLWCVIPLAFLLLDIAVYWQHRWMHVYPLFWKLHRVHHTDLDVDVSTGVRFHPVEILLSQAWKMSVVFILGPPVITVILFELVLSICSLFIHTKLKLPETVERNLVKFIVTPAMHTVHHHYELPETDSNFSTIFSCWDRVFGSYKDASSYQSADSEKHIVFGLREYPDNLSILNLLKLPFKGAAESPEVSKE